jgi:hypothetical protein
MPESKNAACPHCGVALDSWIGPPESMWGEILVCNNNDCTFFLGSSNELCEQSAKENLGCRYAVDPDNGYKPFNLLAWCPRTVRDKAQSA